MSWDSKQIRHWLSSSLGFDKGMLNGRVFIWENFSIYKVLGDLGINLLGFEFGAGLKDWIWVWIDWDFFGVEGIYWDLVLNYEKFEEDGFGGLKAGLV